MDELDTFKPMIEDLLRRRDMWIGRRDKADLELEDIESKLAAIETVKSLLAEQSGQNDEDGDGREHGEAMAFALEEIKVAKEPFNFQDIRAMMEAKHGVPFSEKLVAGCVRRAKDARKIEIVVEGSGRRATTYKRVTA